MAVGQPDQTGRVHRTLTDAGQTAVAALGQGALVQDLDLQAGLFGDLLRDRGQVLGDQVGRGGVDEVAGEGDGVGQDTGALGGLGGAVGLADQGQRGLGVLGGLLTGAVAVEGVGAEPGAQGHGADLVGGGGGQGQDDTARALGARAQRTQRGAGRAGQRVGVDGAVGGRRAETDRDDDRGLDGPEGGKGVHLLEGAARSQERQGRAEATGEGGVDGMSARCGLRGVASGVVTDDNGVGVERTGGLRVY